MQYYVTLKTDKGLYQAKVMAKDEVDAKTFSIAYAWTEGLKVLDVTKITHWGMKTIQGWDKVEA